MSSPQGDPGEVRERWSSGEVAARYAGDRFTSARARGRDPRVVARLLREFSARGPVLDVPCGAGRLVGALSAGGRSVCGCDVSTAMLEQARRPDKARWLVEGDASRLPFASGSFDAVVCCRLLHHLAEREQLFAVVRELVRVSSRLVIASYFDASSLPAWRVRAGLKPRERRVAVPRELIEAAFSRAGAQLLAHRAVLRFVSQQTFAVARKV